jgi:hypothetical protein
MIVIRTRAPTRWPWVEKNKRKMARNGDFSFSSITKSNQALFPSLIISKKK